LKLVRIQRQHIGAINTAKWIKLRMDMLRRLIGPWGKGASKETQQAWLREYDALWEESARLNKLFIEGGEEGKQ
jgi:hypothetical protein